MMAREIFPSNNRMLKNLGAYDSYWVCLVFWLNETNQISKTNQINQINAFAV